jgi:tetratricopeptide (TPR) repeat protein
MQTPRCHFALFLACVFGIGGCASSSPESMKTSPGRTARPVSDSVRVDSASQEKRPVTPRDERMKALRAAYVDGAYEEVVRRARKRRRDSLDAATTIQVNTLLGRAEQARGRHEAAIEALRTARVAASESGRSLVSLDRALGESYVALYRWPQAASAFRRVLDAEPRDRAARQALADVYRESRQWRKARAQYTRLVRADSSNGQWWARLAQCNLELNQTRRARRHFAEAHRHLPQSADVALSLSRLHRARGQFDAARRVVDTTLSHQPGDPRLWRRQADLAFEQDALDTARRAYSRTIATGDSSATAYRRIGLIDVRRQQYARALSSLRQSLQRDSSHARTTLYLGVAYLKLDSLQRATTYLQRTIDRKVQGPLTRALEQLGTTHSQRGRVADAVRTYKTALRLRPDHAALYFHLATVYDEHYRDKTPAARYYRRFLRVADQPRPELRRYAESRLDTLRPALHMQESARPQDRGEEARSSDGG